jgi:hypothetical protein
MKYDRAGRGIGCGKADIVHGGQDPKAEFVLSDICYCGVQQVANSNPRIRRVRSLVRFVLCC